MSQLKRGLEFYIGCILAAGTVIAVIFAIFNPEWRDLLTKIGAPIAVGGAVGAALIAYDGAISKVRFDASAKLEQETRKKRAIFVKLDIACFELYANACDVMAATFPYSVDNTPPARSVGFALSVNEEEVARRLPGIEKRLRLSIPEAFELAWQNLETFDAQQVGMIYRIREVAKQLDDKITSGLKVKEPFSHLNSIAFREDVNRKAMVGRNQAFGLCKSLSSDLDKLIRGASHAKKIEEAERARIAAESKISAP